MTEIMNLIPGRSRKQGNAVNEGKLEKNYLDITSTVEINQDDMERLGLQDGDKVSLRNAIGEIIVSCKGRKPDDLPEGILFIPYGPASSQLMHSDTAGSGMPISKNISVQIKKV